MPYEREARRTYHSQRATDQTIGEHDSTILVFALRCLYRSLIACSAALLLLLVFGPVMLP